MFAEDFLIGKFVLTSGFIKRFYKALLDMLKLIFIAGCL